MSARLLAPPAPAGAARGGHHRTPTERRRHGPAARPARARKAPRSLAGADLASGLFPAAGWSRRGGSGSARRGAATHVEAVEGGTEAPAGQGAVLLLGFLEEELEAAAEVLGEVLGGEAIALACGEAEEGLTIGDVLAGAGLGGDADADPAGAPQTLADIGMSEGEVYRWGEGGGGGAGGRGRVVLLWGACRDSAAELQAGLREFGIGAIVAAAMPKHHGAHLAGVAAGLLSAHEKAWALRVPVARRETSWDPATDCSVALCAAMDQAEVPESTGGCRVDASHIAVLDGLFGEEERQALLDEITAPGWDHTSGHPPEERWIRETVDIGGKPPSWGLRREELDRLLRDPSSAMVEVTSRLQKLYPEYEICHMPAHATEGVAAGGEEDLSPFVGNAAVHGDSFGWHQDADPSTFPPGPWTDRYGWYVNREAGKPLFVTLLLYLDKEWDLAWDAETLFLDGGTSAGIFVRPQPCRALLADQDLPHRLSAPSGVAGRPRYSMVWKLVFFPKAGHGQGGGGGDT